MAAVEASPATKVITRYLTEHSPDFARCAELQRKGWESAAADRFFAEQRRRADEATPADEQHFFDMMKGIAEQLEQHTGAFTCANSRSADCRILDLGVAPGGFLHAALQINYRAKATGITLPQDQGGHEIKLLSTKKMRARILELDVTLLAADLGVDATAIPDTHPDKDNFTLSRQLPASDTFDLVICDGMVLRTHARAAYRQTKDREMRRLIASQLSLALDHIRPGGKIVMLLHKLETWTTASLVHGLSRFADVRLHKPERCHKARSSFYLVASAVRAEHPQLREMAAGMKETWKVATFGTEAECEAAMQGDEKLAEEMVRGFGPRLVEMGTSIWRIQQAALQRASFMQG